MIGPVAFSITDSGALVAAPSPHGQYGSDAFFSGGEVATLDKPGGFNRPPIPATIAGTDDAPVMTTYRKGAFAYQVPVTDAIRSP